MRKPLFVLAALAAVAGQPATAEEPASCAASTTGFVSGTPCLGLGARVWFQCEGCGFEAAGLLGDIPLDNLAEPVVPMRVVANATREGRDIILQLTDPPARSLVLFQTPDTVHDTPDDEVRIRTRGAPGSGVALVWRSLTDPGGGRVLWREMGVNRWTLVFFAEDWRLLD